MFKQMFGNGKYNLMYFFQFLFSNKILSKTFRTKNVFQNVSKQSFLPCNFVFFLLIFRLQSICPTPQPSSAVALIVMCTENAPTCSFKTVTAHG